MNFESAIAAMRAYFADAWGTTTPVAYDDAKFEIPSSTTWVRLNIRHVDGYQATAGDPGNNRHRRVGIITVQVFAKQGNASKDARQKADLAANAFISKDYMGIHFFNPVIREIGPDGSGWYQINVVAQFRYDRIA